LSPDGRALNEKSFLNRSSQGGKQMSITDLKDVPPWEWPQDADKTILEILCDQDASDTDRSLAAGMAGDSTVVNDELANALLEIIGKKEETEELRGRAAIALGPVLEWGFIEDFDDPDEIPITESMFNRIQETFFQLYQKTSLPKLVRRRILEASVRAPMDWHRDAIRDAYVKEDAEWKLTAVFCMQFVRGFDKEILESLSSQNPDIVYEAVCGAGNWEIKSAWPQIAAIVASEETEKDMLLAGIEAAALIRPEEAAEFLGKFLDSDDEDILDAVHEALAMTGSLWDWDDDDDHPTIH
jgi:hypothetical protein